MNKPKVRIYLMGGLGNNLSQLLVAFLLVERGFNVEIINKLCFSNIITRLLRWTIHDQSTSEIYSERFSLKDLSIFSIIVDLLCLKISTIFNSWFLNQLFDNNRITSLENLTQGIQERKKVALGGYWQNLNVYDELNIKKFKQFLFGNNYNWGKDNGKSCIHIRGGDFLKFNHNLNKSYYIKAISFLKNPNGLSVFTNDREFASQMIPNTIPVSFSKNRCAKDDFLEMLNFKELICSNSTFSIWAGLLSNANLVVLPKSDGKFSKININPKLFYSKKLIVMNINQEISV